MTTPTYLKTEASAAERTTDLLARMTLAEKCHQLSGVMPWVVLRADGSDLEDMTAITERPPGHVAQLIRDTPAQLADTITAMQRVFVDRTRLGVPAFFHAEALNGILAGGHVVHPTAIGLAATWSPDLIEAMADLTRRQMTRVGLRHALSPVMDIALDPRWGRVHETYGEDPYLVAAMSVAYTRGLQGDDPRTGVIATGKHFLGYAFPESGMNAATVNVGSRRLRDLFAFPFEAAIREAGLGSIMNSYSDIDGVPVAASREILTTLLRDVLGFDGFVSADYASIEQLYTRQGAASSLAEAGGLALAAGLDVEFPQPVAYGDLLCAEVEAGRVDASLVETSARRVLEAKFRSGLFENPYPAEHIDVAAVAQEGQELSRELAQRGVVMLENSGALPLAVRGKRIAVVGPHADAPELQFAAYSYPSWRSAVDAIHLGGAMTMVGIDADADNWHKQLITPGEAAGLPRERYGTRSLADALADDGADVTVAAGSGLTTRLGDEALDEAASLAQNAELVVVALGGASLWFSGERTEGEASDTADLALPAVQAELLARVVETGTPFVLVLVQGRAYTLPPEAEKASAILVSSYSGPFGPRAIVDVITGAVEPTGRLPYTIPRHVGQVPIYHHRPVGSGGRPATDEYPTGRYLDMEARPAYPFGAGKGWSEFLVEELQVQGSATTDGAFEVMATVTNTGDRTGSTLVQLYARARTAGMVRPFQQLVGFAPVDLDSGERTVVTFRVHADQLAATHPDGVLRVSPGEVIFVAGLDAEDPGASTATVLGGTAREVDSAQRVFFSETEVRGS